MDLFPKQSDINDLKPLFVKLWLKFDCPFMAANALFPNDVKLAMWAGTYWPQLPELIAEKTEIQLSEDTSYLPNKKDVAQMILKKMQGHMSANDWRNYMRDYCEVMEIITRNAPQTNIQINNETKVIEVPVYESVESWESELAQNQKQLLIDAESKH